MNYDFSQEYSEPVDDASVFTLVMERTVDNTHADPLILSDWRYTLHKRCADVLLIGREEPRRGCRFGNSGAPSPCSVVPLVIAR